MVLTSSCTLSMLVRFAVSSEQRVKYNTYMYQVTHTCTYVSTQLALHKTTQS